jgi:hypothetical protein
VYGKQAKIDITNNESNSKRDDGMPSATGKTQNIRQNQIYTQLYMYILAVTANDRQVSNVLDVGKFSKLNNVLGVTEIIKWQKCKTLFSHSKSNEACYFL